jgi:hypothetical protein
LVVIRLTIVMPQWLWWLVLRFRFAIALEVDGEPVLPVDLVGHGEPLTLIYRPWCRPIDSPALPGRVHGEDERTEAGASGGSHQVV